MALALEELLDGPVCHGGTQMHMLEESVFVVMTPHQELAVLLTRD